jgi:hypothetical protein
MTPAAGGWSRIAVPKALLEAIFSGETPLGKINPAKVFG